MPNTASWPLLFVGIAGLLVALGLTIHFYRRRDRRRADRRRKPRRGRRSAAQAIEDRRARHERRLGDRRSGLD